MVRDLLKPALAAWQSAAHFTATALLILAAIVPLEATARAAGAALLLSNGLAFSLLARAARSPSRLLKAQAGESRRLRSPTT
jgi:hypothetical protein